jgi:hypothetical protein
MRFCTLLHTGGGFPDPTAVASALHSVPEARCVTGMPQIDCTTDRNSKGLICLTQSHRDRAAFRA